MHLFSICATFFCAGKGDSVGLYFQKRIISGLFDDEGFIIQKLEGDGFTFIDIGGTILERKLGPC